MDINEIQSIEIPQRNNWVVKLNKLVKLPPDIASQVTGLRDGFTAWDLFFMQDLFQALSADKRYLIDIGWYPDGEPSGNFRLVLIEKRENSSNSEYDWDKPIIQYETRSVDKLLLKVRELMRENASGK